MNQQAQDSPNQEMIQYGNADDDDDKSSASIGSLNHEEAELEPDIGSVEADSAERRQESKPTTGGKSRQKSKRVKSRSVRQKSKKNNLVPKHLGGIDEEYEEDAMSPEEGPNTID